MKSIKKTPKVPGFIRVIIADNTRAMMKKVYSDVPNKPLALSKDAGVSKSTIQRILAGETGATADNLEGIATALQISAYQLLIPNLDIGNPQIVQGASKDEERLYAHWRRTKRLGDGVAQ